MVLAVIDISVTAGVQPICAATLLRILLGTWDCLFANIFLVISAVFLRLSLIIIVILTLHSYTTLAYPYSCQSIFTKRRLSVAVQFSSLLIIISVSLPYLFTHTQFIFYLMCVLHISPTLVIVLSTWIWIYKLVARHRRAIETTQTPAGQEIANRKKILKSTITAFLVTFSLFGCYSLELVISLYKLIENWRVDHSVHYILHTLSLTLMCSNSSLNHPFYFGETANSEGQLKISSLSTDNGHTLYVVDGKKWASFCNFFAGNKIKQDACSGVNSACKAGIIIVFRQPRIIETYRRNRDFYGRYLQDIKP